MKGINNMKKPSLFLQGSVLLKGLGLSLTKKLSVGEYRVNYIHGKEATACYTDDLQDAIDTGLLMWKENQ